MAAEVLNPLPARMVGECHIHCVCLAKGENLEVHSQTTHRLIDINVEKVKIEKLC